MLTLDQKKTLVENLHGNFQQAVVVIVTDYKGLNVEEVNALRRKLQEVGVEYRVIKNTLLKRAVQDTDLELLTDFFVGPTSIALGYDDPVPPAKVLSEFAKDNDKLEIKAGVLKGSLLTAEQITALAKLPSREVLLSQFLSVLNAVPTSFVRVLNGVPTQLVNVLSAIKEQKAAA